MFCVCRRRSARTPTFPIGAFRDAGYPHIAICGQKGYHGVAVVSRMPSDRVLEARLLLQRRLAPSATSGSAARREGSKLHNFYVPAGGDEPDPEINVEIRPQARLCRRNGDVGGRGQGRPAGRAILVGDLNIAPLEHDVWSHKALLNVVSHTADRGRETENRRRRRVPGSTRCANSSRRSEALHVVELSLARLVERQQGAAPGPHLGQPRSRAGSVKSMHVLREARGWERPSDHVPVKVHVFVVEVGGPAEEATRVRWAERPHRVDFRSQNAGAWDRVTRRRRQGRVARASSSDGSSTRWELCSSAKVVSSADLQERHRRRPRQSDYDDRRASHLAPRRGRNASSWRWS